MTDPQLLEIMKVTAWQQCVIGSNAAWSIREALSIDTTPSPPLPPASHSPGEWTPQMPLARPDGPSPSHPRDRVNHPPLDRQTLGVWAATQLLLSAAANVSKLLWPPRGDEHQASAGLQHLLSVDESSPLYERKLRDSFEHLGPRIITWYKEHKGSQYADPLILPSRADLPDPPPLRAFLEDEFAVIFIGQTFELGPLEESLKEIATRADPTGGTHL